MKEAIYILFILLCSGCVSHHSNIAFENKSFEDILGDTSLIDKDHVLFLIRMKDCVSCDLLQEGAFRDRKLLQRLSDKYMCVEQCIDLEEDKFVAQLLYEYSFPMIVVFSKRGILEALVIGNRTAKELTLMLDKIEAHRGFVTNTRNRFVLNDTCYVDLIKKTVNAFLALKSEDLGKAKDEIEASIKIQPYFYNLYIGSQIYKELGDTVRFIECTDQALKMNDRFDNLLYNSIKEKIGNPAEELDLVTSISFEKTIHDFGRISSEDSVECSFLFKNNNSFPVIIESIKQSCDCMEIIWDTKPVLPQKIGTVKVIYKPSSKGVFMKALFLTISKSNKIIPLHIKGVVI